jgi:hypothetical protein
MGTGAESNLSIQVSISLTSCSTMEEAPSPACPVRTLHTLSLGICLDPPTRLGLEDSLQASISFFKMNKHSRNMVKKGWWERRHNEVREWLRTLCKRPGDELLAKRRSVSPVAADWLWGRASGCRRSRSRSTVPSPPV